MSTRREACFRALSVGKDARCSDCSRQRPDSDWRLVAAPPGPRFGVRPGSAVPLPPPPRTLVVSRLRPQLGPPDNAEPPLPRVLSGGGPTLPPDRPLGQ